MNMTPRSLAAMHKVRAAHPTAALYNWSTLDESPYYDMLWIETDDGVRLSGDFYHPDNAWIDAAARL